MARVVLPALLVLVACGDNRPRPAQDAPADDATAAAACGVHGGTVGFKQIAYGCGMPGATQNCLHEVVTLVTSPPNDHRLFVLERSGQIRIIDHDELRPAPFLDLSALPGFFTDDAEMGLLGLAFHPHYASNGFLFVFLTKTNPDTADTLHPYLDVIERFTVDPNDPQRADPQSRVTVIAVPDPFTNHNGGMVEFGLDGYLYFGIGDGGGRANLPADPYNSAQDLSSLLGKISRIDVDHPAPGQPYGIPADNPYAAGGGRPEVWIRGLRNPWRWSFDRATGDLWIGDVGHALYEELDVLRAGEQAGKNLGWPMWEGNSCYAPPCTTAGMTFPQSVHDHPNDGWWSVIGGQVYRGTCYPDLVGTYFYTDCGHGHLYAATLDGNGGFHETQLPGEFVGIIFEPTSLHADAFGELYQTQISGNVYRMVVEGGTP